MCLWYCKFGIELYWCCNISSFIKRCHTLFYSKVFQNIYPPFLIFQLSLATLHAKKNTKFPSGLWYIHRTSQFMVVRKKNIKQERCYWEKPPIFIWCFKHSLSFFALRIPSPRLRHLPMDKCFLGGLLSSYSTVMCSLLNACDVFYKKMIYLPIKHGDWNYQKVIEKKLTALLLFKGILPPSPWC